MTENDIIVLLNRIYNSSTGNFLSTISASNKSNVSVEKITPYKIAREIANYIDKSPDSYKNIASLLEIDRESLKIDKNDSTHTYAQAIKENLPYKFINFVKSNDWIKYSSNDNEIPNLTLHAKLRLIDRFALNNAKNIDELYSDETKSKLKGILKIAA
jgi:hypothetical protein